MINILSSTSEVIRDGLNRAYALCKAFGKRIEGLRFDLSKTDHLRNRSNYVRVIDLDEDRKNER